MLVFFSTSKEPTFCFSNFLCYFMSKTNDLQSQETIMKLVNYPPSYRKPLLHQLADDGKLYLMKNVINFIVKSNKLLKNGAIDINLADHDRQSVFMIALKHKNKAMVHYLLKTFHSKLDLSQSNKKHGSCLSLVFKLQDFEIIDKVMAMYRVTDNDNHVLNFIVPNFEKNPSENAKYMVKLILEKGVDPNKSRSMFLQKSKVKDESQLSVLPDQILEINPIALAC